MLACLHVGVCVYIDTRTHTVSIVCEAAAKEMEHQYPQALVVCCRDEALTILAQAFRC